MLAVKRNKFGNIYYTLVGGGVDLGEDLETALRRELREETQMEVGDIRPVFMENAEVPFGPQFIFLCQYTGGNPALSPDSDEAKISALGQNMYETLWIALSDIPNLPFRSSSVAEAILNAVKNGFPETPQELAWKPETVAK